MEGIDPPDEKFSNKVAEKPGDKIGRFELLEEIGEGCRQFFSGYCDVILYNANANNFAQNAPDGFFWTLMNKRDFRGQPAP